jgi:hypothetical protein
MPASGKKRSPVTSDDAIDQLTSGLFKKVRICDCPRNPLRENDEIGSCWTWLRTTHPAVYDRILHHGSPNGALFRAYVSSVYRGMRLVRPDVIQPLGTIDSIAGNCRAFGRIVDMFPCVF